MVYEVTETCGVIPGVVDPHFHLLETDAPYLAPQPVRGKVNQPGYIGMTYRFIAESRGISIDHLTDQVFRNYRKLFFG
ncbi:MAG TPA: TatD family hydrolase [Spirochaetia bacterium]|nr:TatD family hydrolase [Spirochaetia bacterium]